MLKKKSVLLMKVLLLAAIGAATTAPMALAENWWAGGERSGTCLMTTRNYNFRCEWGPYEKVSGARQIGGFYINPTESTNRASSIVLQYRTNGGNWVDRRLTMNATTGNYIDFGDGVTSFSYRFTEQELGEDLYNGDTTISFTMNYDLDR